MTRDVHVFVCALLLVLAAIVHAQTTTPARTVHIVGGGIAGLTAAVFLVQNSSVPGHSIHVYDENELFGGALDAIGDVESGYEMRGGRMFEMNMYHSLFALFKAIPYVRPPSISSFSEQFVKNDKQYQTLYDDFEAFNRDWPVNSTWHLIDANGERILTESLNLTLNARTALAALFVTPESLLANKTVAEFMPASFFKSNFWYMWAAMLGFQQWTSIIDLKRYMLRLIQVLPYMSSMTVVRRSRFVNYESIVLPIVMLLESRGVHMHNNARVEDVEFETVKPASLFSAAQTAIKSLTVDNLKTGQRAVIPVGHDDRVFITVGSLIADSVTGSHLKPAVPLAKSTSGAFRLWQKMAKKVPEMPLGDPDMYANQIPKSRFIAFTCTLRNGPEWLATMEKYGNSILTFPKSKWMLSYLIKGPEPHFANIPKDVYVGWGYGRFADVEGDYIKKRMVDCNGREMLEETIRHFHWKNISALMNGTVCKPHYMPYVTSQYLCRHGKSRPRVVPDGATNFALMGQFVEIEDDTVFTVEQSVHSGMIAVQKLVSPALEVPDIYRGQYDLDNLAAALKAMNA